MGHKFFSKRILWLTTLIILMMGVSARGFDSRWVAHEFDHESRLALVESFEHSHVTLPENANNEDQTSALGDVEHHLLHAVSHCELSPIPSPGAVPIVSCSSIRVSPILQAIPPSKSERTFRPPRSASLA